MHNSNSINSPQMSKIQEDSFPLLKQQETPIKQEESSAARSSFKKKGWTFEQDTAYRQFLKQHLQLFKPGYARLLNSCSKYRLMSKFIGTKTQRQCQRHHRYTIRKYRFMEIEEIASSRSRYGLMQEFYRRLRQLKQINREKMIQKIRQRLRDQEQQEESSDIKQEESSIEYKQEGIVEQKQEEVLGLIEQMEKQQFFGFQCQQQENIYNNINNQELDKQHKIKQEMERKFSVMKPESVHIIRVVIDIDQVYSWPWNHSDRQSHLLQSQ